MDYIIFIKVFSGILRSYVAETRKSLVLGTFFSSVGNFQNQLRISSPSQPSFFQSVACLDLNLSFSQSLCIQVYREGGRVI